MAWRKKRDGEGSADQRFEVANENEGNEFKTHSHFNRTNCSWDCDLDSCTRFRFVQYIVVVVEDPIMFTCEILCVCEGQHTTHSVDFIWLQKMGRSRSRSESRSRSRSRSRGRRRHRSYSHSRSRSPEEGARLVFSRKICMKTTAADGNKANENASTNKLSNWFSVFLLFSHLFVDCRLHVGDLGIDCSKTELEDRFKK